MPDGDRPATTLLPRLDGEDIAAAYARTLLGDLAIHPRRTPTPADEHPALSWARSGLMSLTGEAKGPPEMCPVPLAACADGALAALASLAVDATAFAGTRGSALLVERAAIVGLSRRGAVSPGGGCRLLQAADGCVAVNLARDDDWSLLPAWLETPAADWEAVIAAVRTQPTMTLVERARWLGLAVAPSQLGAPATGWFDTVVTGPSRVVDRGRRPRVVDLSSLWAGPLCGRLLMQLGAEVIKVESRARPDGARNGPIDFFDAMNAGKASVALDFNTAQGLARLKALIDQADIVIEASRPRALRQLGIDAEARVRDGAGLTWISLTGYGRRGPQDQWIAYGDDAGVAGGLSELLRIVTGRSLFCADAVGDPLTGLHAALAAWASHRAGGGRLLSIAMRDVVSYVTHFGAWQDDASLRTRTEDWRRRAVDQIRSPQAPRPAGSARVLGADTDEVLRCWAVAC